MDTTNANQTAPSAQAPTSTQPNSANPAEDRARISAWSAETGAGNSGEIRARSSFPTDRSPLPNRPAHQCLSPERQPQRVPSSSAGSEGTDTAAEAERVLRPAQIVLLNGILYQPVQINGLPYLMSLSWPQIERQLHESVSHQSGEQDAAAARILNGHRQRQQDQQRQQQQNQQNNVSAVQLALKIAFFLLIFCRNASTERIILMHLFGLVIFLHQTGRLRIIRDHVLPNGDVAFERGQRRQAGAAAETAAGDGPAPAGALEVVARAAWTFLASMVPAGAPVAPPEE